VPLLIVGRGLGVDLLLGALLVSQELWVHLFGGLDSVYFVNYTSGSLATSSQANDDALIES